MSFQELPLEELKVNPMHLIGQDWWLITAGNEENGYNTMTAAWGGLGALWQRAHSKHSLPSATIYVRPQRYTKAFLDREELFTLSVLAPEQRKALGYLGSHSGRDGDKVAAAGLTPVFVDGSTTFAQARLVFVCRKLYHAPLLESGFVDTSLVESDYPERDFHEMYVGEILKILVQE